MARSHLRTSADLNFRCRPHGARSRTAACFAALCGTALAYLRPRRGIDVLVGCLASHKLVSEIAVAGCETLGGTCVGQGKGD